MKMLSEQVESSEGKTVLAKLAVNMGMEDDIEQLRIIIMQRGGLTDYFIQLLAIENNEMLSFDDGHVEYWSTYSIGNGLAIFNSMTKALDHMHTANDSFVRGVQFHKEMHGKSILPSDI